MKSNNSGARVEIERVRKERQNAKIWNYKNKIHIQDRQLNDKCYYLIEAGILTPLQFYWVM